MFCFRKRKFRSDKKTQVAPTVSRKFGNEVERLSMIADKPIKDIGEILCNEGIRSVDVIDLVSMYFQNGTLNVNDSLFFGSKENPRLESRVGFSSSQRISIRFKRHDFENIRLLAGLLEVTPSRAVAVLLDASIRHPEIYKPLLALGREGKEKEKRKFRRFVNTHNPYK